MIVYPEDIEREGGVDLNTLEGEDKFSTKNLPFGLTGYYDGNKYFALYGKNSELVKIGGISKREAECIIIGVIEAFRHIESVMFDEGIID